MVLMSEVLVLVVGLTVVLTVRGYVTHIHTITPVLLVVGMVTPLVLYLLSST